MEYLFHYDPEPEGRDLDVGLVGTNSARDCPQ